MAVRARGVLAGMTTITRTTALIAAVLSGALAIATLSEPAHEPGRAQLKPAEFVIAESVIKGNIQHPHRVPLRPDVLPPRAPA
jgi:hypothetical protein